MKKKEVILITLLIGIFLISFTSATTLGTLKQSDCVNLIQICSNCTYNNISTILFPNSSIAITNATMDRDDTYYNYTFCNTSTLGIYIVNGYGNLNGVKTTWNYDFEITPTGRDFDSGQSITAAGIMFSALIISALFMFLGFKLGNNETLIPVAFLLIAASVGLIIYSLFMAYGISSDIVQYAPFSELSEIIFITVLWVVVAGFVLFMALMLIAFIRELGRVVERKKFGEDWDPISKSYQ